MVVNADDANAMRAVQDVPRRIMTFGTSETADVRPVDISIEKGYYHFTVEVHGQPYTTVTLNVPGKHNMLNALAACAVLGI